MPTSAAPQPGAERKRRARKNRKAMPSPEGECSACSESHEENEVREGVEDSECCAEKKGKPKCSACAAGKPCSGRGDALTAQDYLTACDLGIADRSRPYIRARLDAMSKLTPAAVRKDLRAASATPGRAGKKCGNSYIPASANCSAGQGSKLRRGVENAAIAGGLAVTVGGVASGIRQVGKGNFKAANRSFVVANAGNALAGAGMRAKGKRTGNKALQKEGRNAMVQGTALSALGLAISGDLDRTGRAVGKGVRELKRGSLNIAGRASALKSNFTQRKAKSRLETMYKQSGRRDSIWAPGFSVDTASLEA